MEFRRSTLFIDLLAVDPRHRSRRWGTRLMERAETVGKKKGCILSRVYVDEHNNRAIRFYERCGYRLIRHLPALRIVEMAKPLAHGELADYA